MLDTDFPIRTNDSILIDADPFEQGGMTLRKIFEIVLMDLRTEAITSGQVSTRLKPHLTGA